MGKKKRLKKAKIQPANRAETRRSKPKVYFPNILIWLDSFLHSYKFIYYLIPIGLFFTIGILLFDPSIEPMQDDSGYIIAPVELIQNGIYPTFHSVFYSVIMSIPALLFGVSIIGYKVMSFIFAFIGVLLFLKYYKEYFNYSIVFLISIIIAINPFIQYYSSAVMSESFFMMLQTLCVIVALRYIDDVFNKDQVLSYVNGKINYKYFSLVFLLASVFFVLSITKNLATLSIICVIVYLLMYKKWKESVILITLYSALRVIYSLLISVIFGSTTVSSQFNQIFYKNYYDPSQGIVDFYDLIVRYWQNLNYHLSSDLLRVLGFRENVIGVSELPLFSIAFVFGSLILMWYMFKYKKRSELLLAFYLIIQMSVVFAALQTHWKQDRMIIIFIPFILLFISSAILSLSNHKIVANTVLVSLVALLVFQIRHIPAYIDSLNERFYLQNVDYSQHPFLSRYTPDWQNYILMSKWIEQNLDMSAVVGVRKVNTSKVFTSNSKKFSGFTRSTQLSGEDVLIELEQRRINHLMACNLRLNPTVAVEGQIIGTVYSYLYAIYNYDPTRIEVLHEIGQTEPCTLYKVRL